MLIHLQGNLLHQNLDLILHQANCITVMGGGIAKEIRATYPEVYEADRNFSMPRGDSRLGNYSYAKVTNKMTGMPMVIANVYGQNGIQWDGIEPLTHYGALEEGLRKAIKELTEKYDLKSVGVPYLMGCGLAHGDWTRVESILYNISEDLEIDIYMYEYRP